MFAVSYPLVLGLVDPTASLLLSRYPTAHAVLQTLEHVSARDLLSVLHTAQSRGSV